MSKNQVALLLRRSIQSRLRAHLPRAEFGSITQRLLDGLGYTSAELSVVLTDDRQMRALNRDFRGKDKTTDVLSFPLVEGRAVKLANGPLLLGDVVISVPAAVRQAREYGVSVREELLRLLVHGVLHLAGYNHVGVSPGEAKRMRRLERRLLKDVLKER